MAIVKFGPTVIGARGLIAGTIFSANKSGPYARAWSKGANPQSLLQSEHRGLFSDISSEWRDLSTAQRNDWIDYADDPAQERTNTLGENFFASGFNWFVLINLNLEAAGAARRVDAPTLVRPLVPVIETGALRITDAAFNSNIRFDVTDPAIGSLHTAFAKVFNSRGRTTASSKRTFLDIAIPDVNRDLILQDELETAFGTIQLLQIAFFASRIQDAHGQRGPAAVLIRNAQT